LDADNQYEEAELQAALEACCLSDLKLNDKASSLSGGQTQLISLVQAMLNKSSNILLLDEPTS